MATALHDETQAVFAREVHGRSDILGIAGSDAVGAGRGRPRIGPAAGLGQPRRIADVPGVLQATEKRLALRPSGRGPAGVEGRLDARELTTHPAVEVLPLRRRRPSGVAGAVTSERGPLRIGSRHQRQPSSELEQVASVHDRPPEISGADASPLLVNSLILLEIVTSGEPSGTTGDAIGTIGQLRTGTSASKRWR